MQRALDAGAVVVTELAHIVRDVVEVRRRNRMVGQQHLAARDAGFGLAAKVEDDLQQLARVDPIVQRPGEVGREGSCEQLDLLVPSGHARMLRLSCFSHQPNEGTSPFSRTGFDTRMASSLTSSNCVSKTLNPRPLRASIMCES